jgi:predicted P-loop ATPase
MTFDMSMDSKEAHMAIQGCWVAELAELDSLRKTTETRLKSFISQQADDYVPKYSNYRVTHPRRTVFIGTTNETRYLQGNTGHTRWAPVNTAWFDLERIEREREQMIAEALFILKTTPDVQWWEEPESLKEELAAERKDRQIENVYEDDLRLWLDGELPGHDHGYFKEITWRKIATDYLKMQSPDQWKDKRAQMEITAALKNIGWRKKSEWDKGEKKSTMVWKRDGDDTPF